MSLHQFGSQHESSDPPRPERLTADEARAVIALWQEERVAQTGLTDRPAVPDVAEGLDVPVEEVQRLLAQVRARRVEEEAALAKEQELAWAEARLAEEEARLAGIQRQRAELDYSPVEVIWQPPRTQRKPAAASPRHLGKPVQAVAWTGEEEFWRDTEEDKEARAAYQANSTKRAATYAIYTALLLLPLGFVLWLLYVFLMALVN